MSARFPATVSLSFAELARHGGFTGPHADGWGIAYYEDRDARVLREPHPASASPWVRFIEAQALRSTLVLSHVRKATQGDVALRNTQPFARPLGARMHVFAHNGHMPGIDKIIELTPGRHLPIGETDSEILFGALLQRLEPLSGGRHLAERQQRIDAVSTIARHARMLGPANFIYTDGELLFAHGNERTQEAGQPTRPPGLYMLSRRCPAGDEELRAAGVRVRAGHPEQEVVLFASTPLTDEPWQPLAQGELIVVSDGQVLQHGVP